MKDPQDCTYPQEALCLHDCKQECQKRSGWRKAQIDDAEEEAWRELEKASAMREVQRLGQEIEATERKWVDLTDDEIDRVTDAQWGKNVNKPIYAAHRAYARAVEAASKEKNT